MDNDCVLCAEPSTVWAIFPCRCPNVVCANCVAKLRCLSGSRCCPLCKEDAEFVVASKLRTRTFESFGTYGSSCGPLLELDADSGIFFNDDDALRDLMLKRQLRCGYKRKRLDAFLPVSFPPCPPNRLKLAGGIRIVRLRVGGKKRKTPRNMRIEPNEKNHKNLQELKPQPTSSTLFNKRSTDVMLPAHLQTAPVP